MSSKEHPDPSWSSERMERYLDEKYGKEPRFSDARTGQEGKPLVIKEPLVETQEMIAVRKSATAVITETEVENKEHSLFLRRLGNYPRMVSHGYEHEERQRKELGLPTLRWYKCHNCGVEYPFDCVRTPMACDNINCHSPDIHVHSDLDGEKPATL